MSIGDWVIVALPAALLAMFTDNLWHSLQTYRHARAVFDRRADEPARSLRNFVLAIGLWLGVGALFLRTVAYFGVHEWEPVARAIGSLAYGGLLVVGGFVTWSWHRRE